MFAKSSSEKKESDAAPDPLGTPKTDKMLAAFGVNGLRTAAFTAQSSPDGTLLQFFVGVPEAGILPVLEELRKARYVAVTESGLWIISRDLARIPLADLVHRFGFGVAPAADALCHSDLGRRVCRYLDAAVASEDELLKISLAKVVAAETPPNR